LKDEAILMIIFLTALLATLLKWQAFIKQPEVNSSTSYQSTGDPLMDEILKDYPDLRS
jgi:hypothetical protein